MSAFASMALGAPGTAIANALKSPSVRRAAWSAVQGALTTGGEALGKYGPVLYRALQNGGTDEVMAMHEALMQTDKDYATRVLEGVQGQTP